MKSRPILFNSEMVRAILDGAKTQTRREIKPQPTLNASAGFVWRGGAYGLGPDRKNGTSDNFAHTACPFGKPGDRLWVRETWMDLRGIEGAVSNAMYRATFGNAPEGCRWRPSIYMPRWASRIILDIVSVRAERLNDISQADAKAEGSEEGVRVNGLSPMQSYRLAELGDNGLSRHRMGFASLWESINGPGSWDASPWVWVVEFKRVEAWK